MRRGDVAEHQMRLMDIDLRLDLRRGVGLAGLYAVLIGGVAGCGDADQSRSSIGNEWGTVSFPISCRPQLQSSFNRAVAILHSFEFAEAAVAFQELADTDPDCATAHWGVAASYGRVVWGTAWFDLERGAEAIQRAVALGGGTAREQAYIDAWALLFEPSEGLAYGTRVQRFAARMEQVHRDHPEDMEAALFYAISLLGTIDAMDTSYAVQRQAGAVAERVFHEQPNHPGAAHYVIHAYDYPPLASQALPAARRYAKIAPVAAHALHMPSHIFARLGLWEEVIQTNRASNAAAVATGGWTEVAHTLDYMTYAHLQRGEDSTATHLMAELAALGNEYAGDYGVLEHVADIKARSMIERQAWWEYESLDLDPDLSRFPRFEATVRLARSLGAARRGNVAAGRREVERLSGLHAMLTAADEHYYAANVAIWRQVAEAWLSYAVGATEKALDLMQVAVQLDDNTAYVGSFESGPDALLHTREQLADLLLQLDRPAEALREYEADLEGSPNRFSSLFGAGRAAELAGNRHKAEIHYRALLRVAVSAENDRPALQQAKKFLARVETEGTR